ncbi:MAG TPA: N-acyl homoserine lactonase family protein [Caldimonas sp.]|nr:N-acyl homoserine lactonase family protein [Caldimonas sp.]
MPQRIRWQRAFAALAVSWLFAACAPMGAPPATTADRLYVIDCGEARIPDVSPWSPGVNVGVAAVFSDNCYLVRHGADWMLWDSGYPDALVDVPEGVVGARNSRAFRKTTLRSQLAAIGVAPEQVRYVAFSHTHGDHVGNANLFAGSPTILMQQAEYDAAFGSEPARYGFQLAGYEQLRRNSFVKLNGDHDVFGDGSVMILSTPGHTPGHQSLLVRLPKTGVVVLSGDVAHFQHNFASRRVPSFNYDAAQSRASMDKLDRIVKAEHGQLWINHDAAQSATLPHAPQFVD